MQLSKLGSIALLLLSVTGVASARETILVLDDCDPRDSGWSEIGGCTLEKGDVSVAEFNALLPEGHPAWRFEPAYLKIEKGDKLSVVNRGGRLHTFTEVEDFGGGFIPQLNPPGSEPAPECLDQAIVDASTLQPGARLKFQEDEAGLELYQCCLHPWMRMAIRVKSGEDDDEDSAKERDSEHSSDTVHWQQRTFE